MRQISIFIEDYRNNNKFIEDYRNNNKNEQKSVDIYADFKDERDYVVFNDELNITTKNNATAFILKGIKHSKRIAIGKYYTINVESIKKFYEVKLLDDSYLYGFELSPRNGFIVPFEELFTIQNLKESDYYGGASIETLRKSQSLPIEIDNNIEVVVNNVWQGNWNEAKCNGETRIVFDMGAPLHAKKIEVEILVNRILPRYHNLSRKPVMILSHWDKDHYHAMLGLSNAGLSLFDCFIFPGNPPTATSKRILNKINNNNISVIIVRPDYRKRGMPSLPKSIWVGPNYEIFIGQEHNDRNLSGIQMFLHSQTANVILSGDCGWFQIIHILTKKSASIQHREVCNLVVPHHGSGEDKTYFGFTIPFNMDKGLAVISVDKNGNSYGHPSTCLINYLNNYFTSIYRTDVNMADIKISL